MSCSITNVLPFPEHGLCRVADKPKSSAGTRPVLIVLAEFFLADRSNGSANPTGCVSVCLCRQRWCIVVKCVNGSSWFWFEGYQTGQLLCIRWGPDPPAEKYLHRGGLLDLENFQLACPYDLFFSFKFTSAF